MKRNRFFQSVIIAIILSTIASAEEKRPAALGSPEPAPAEVNQAQFPYVGEVTGTDLNIRSGPGMNYYACGKISSPLRVIVVAQKYSWLQILPPPGSFSWIFKQYVLTDVNNPGVGVVNGDNVRVYAGADDRDAMISDSIQILLKKDQKVRIIGSAVGDYYKIASPEGATLWTSNQYIKFIRKADEIDVKVPKTGETGAISARPGVLMEQVDANSRQLEQYYTLVKQLDDEKAKPLEEQDFSKIKAELQALAADANNGKAAEYAKYALKTVARCELAKESITVVENQESQLQQKLTEIEKSREEQKEKLTDTSKYAVIGIFRHSLVYEGQPNNRRFLIVDNDNTPICYAEPVGALADANFTDYYEQKVGLVGEITSATQANFALIKFTEIEKIETPAAENKESTDKEKE